MSTKQFNKKRSAPDAGGKPSKFAKTGGGGPKTATAKWDWKANKTGSFVGNGKPRGGDKGKAPAKAKDEGSDVKRRKQPVTLGVEGEGEGMDVDGVAQDKSAGGAEGSEKKPRLSKAEKAALHAAQPHRTTLLPSHPLLQELSPLWETARRAEMPKEERKKAIDELWNAVKGRVGEISKGHKGGRILQTIVKYGGKEERLGVAMELRPQWRAMMESKYSKFLMSKLVRYCPQIRPLLIKDLAPHLSKLLFHEHAVQPLSDFFDLYASAKERRLFVRGFYPREVLLFDGGKDGEAATLEETLEKMGEGKGRDRVLDGVEKAVLGPFNSTQKTALAQAIFHRLVFEYLSCLYRFADAETADTKMHELLTASLESLPEIIHTKDGSAVVRELIVRGNAKDRKQILQQLRKHIPAMSKDADAQLVLFTAFDCVDDTKLMGKAFVADVVALTSELASDKNGRRALLYLLTPTSTRHYMPSTLSSLAASSQQARDLGTSKKDPAVRRKELLGYASEGLLKAIEEKGEDMVRDPGAGLVVQEIMLHTQGDKKGAIEALVAPLRVEYPDVAPEDSDLDPSTSHPFDLSHAVRTYKALLSGGHFNTSTKSIEVIDPSLPLQFAEAVWHAVVSEDAGGADNAVRLAKGNAPFVLVEMIAALKGNGSGLVGEKGAALLAEKLGEL
ncbi:pumilio domain member 6 [Saitozyma podzolica]|uniref:Pumilio domain member 6 n=1 Tax=Saitozyma podzolica TaxID=1890683 RepID=A0A427YJI7_9TREE|nr:pumilio domain member 6 [Saitozyma podzolica]